MLKINRFLGFTDKIKEPRKTKVEDELMKAYRYNGNIYTAIEFLCVKLLEGCYPEVEENYQYYKRNGELSKPKTLYKYMNSEGRSYFELNKTQYDFVCYLIENGLTTEEKIFTYDKNDCTSFETAQKAIEEKERQEREQKQKETEERNEVMNRIKEEALNISDEEKKLVNNIFLSIYGEANNWNYSLVALIHNFDNKYCKEEVIARLHNDNKASIKIFECITGLKLPKTYKERKAYLEALTSADFSGMKEYKPRKKAEHTEEKEVQKETFYILLGNYTWSAIVAEALTKYGLNMFIHFSEGLWCISSAEVGMKIVSGKTKTECLQKLKEYINNNGSEKLINSINANKERIYNKAGVNPRYKVA